jgi:hypothetical protein
MAEQVDNQNETAMPRPGDSHLLQLYMIFRVMVAVTNQKARHSTAGPGRSVEVSGNDQAGPALKDQVIDSKTISMKGARDECFWRFSSCWELA